MHKEITASLAELARVVNYLEENLPANVIIFLTGDLAAGKTTLTSAIAQSRGIESDVTSPTFSLQQCYGGDLFHYDLYRIDNEAFFDLGLHEEFEKPGWHLVEWADESLKGFLANAGYNTASVLITPVGESRNYRIEV
ncbi:MAG TPA: tRNA (adenosine(37)-N6)-threonylcarbamoyltransferase complex ATPase subunit type 1 TsaE [Epsilonproteobacteria bacterium]|nr:tRNA (adenosine(37)-N6)-threonylcarbamoyltransferase complex ATPase subunit type 1 TsaE [Campylobacterota bacterium]